MPSPTDRLLTQLNQTQLAIKDNPLYQVIKQLIGRIKELENEVTSGSGGGGGGSSVTNNTFLTQQLMSPLAYLGEGDRDTYYIPVGITSETPVSGDDYVVLSDGVTPIPAPVHDGAGNFIYVAYTP